MAASTVTPGYTAAKALDGSVAYDCDFCAARASDLEAARAHRAVHVAGPALLAALQGLGVHPEFDYCFCLNRAQQKAGHAGECREARAAIAKAVPPQG